MPTPSVAKVIQYLPNAAVQGDGTADLTQVQAGIILQVNPLLLKVYGTDGISFLVPNGAIPPAVQDDTQTTPNSWTYASQTS